MAEGRFLSKTIAHSAQLADLHDAAEVLFYRMLPHLDCEGRMAGDPKLVKAIAVPLKDAYTVEVVTDLLYVLAETKDSGGTPLLFWYEVKGKRVIQYPGFASHQRGLRKDKEAPSRLPTMADGAVPVARRQRTRTKDGVRPEQVRSRSDSMAEEVGVREGKGSRSLREVEGKVPPDGGSPETWLTPFSDAWKASRGEPPHGRMAKRLRSLTTAHGLRQTLLVWGGYLEERRDKAFCTPEDFADNYEHYRRKWGVEIGEDGTEIPVPDEPLAVGAA